MIRPLYFVLVLALAFPSLDCRRKPDPPRYPLKGKVVSLEPDRKEALIAHEDIPGYMPAMTMPFPVRDERMFKLLSVGDEVTATLVVADTTHWLEDVMVQRKGPPGAAPGPASLAEPKAGDPVPDVTLRDDGGKPFRLADERGHAVVLTFIFTRCPLTEFCPRMTGQFAEIEKELAKDEALWGRTRLLSISFDPAHDTPEVLRHYAKPFRPEAARRHWVFASGSAEEVRAIGTFFGLEYEEESGQFTHNLRTAVVGPDGKIVRVWRGSDWAVAEVLAEIAAAARSVKG